MRKDLLGGLGPDERFAAVVPAVDEGSDRGDEVVDRTPRSRRALSDRPPTTPCPNAARNVIAGSAELNPYPAVAPARRPVHPADVQMITLTNGSA
jgi:hypothetical protein